MKRLFPIFALVFALLAVGCKPSEKHYRQAYESAVAKRDSIRAIEETIYGRFRDLASVRPVPVGNDTLWVTTEQIGYTENGGATRENTKAYNVVVGRFKQSFTAKELRRRLLENGYDSAMILHTREPLYYVVALSVETPAQALEGLRTVVADSTLSMRPPLPFVLHPAHLPY